MIAEHIRALLLLAGIGQLALALSSLAIPRVLGWKAETAKLKPLTGQVFWTYAGYIWATNVAFGLVSAFAPEWLLAPFPLARAVAGFIAFYWGARVGIQFFYFDRSSRPPGAVFVLAEWGMVGLFAFLAFLYGWVAVYGGGGA